MLGHRKRAGTSPARRKWHRATAVGASLAAATLGVVAMAGTAGAVGSNVNYPAAAANNTIVGSGSSTDYDMMQDIDELFNRVPGCVITSGSVTYAPTHGHQELNYACETATGGSAAGKVLEQVPGSAYLDNPINDVAVEEAPMGSSNGIAQLEIGANQSKTTIGTAFTTSTKEQVSPINFARSSRTSSPSKDVKGLNFVAYAKDGISTFYFSKFADAATVDAKIADTLTITQIGDIYRGTVYDWGQLGAKKSAPIFVYSAQEGSGTQSTFKTFLDDNGFTGLDPSATTNKVNCTDPVPAGTAVKTVGKPVSKADPEGVPATFTKLVTPSKPTVEPLTTTSATCKGPDVIFENEDSSILANAGATATSGGTLVQKWLAANPGANAVGDSIFFYSYGKFSEQCAGVKEKVSYLTKSSIETADSKAGSTCGSTTLPKTDKVALSKIAKTTLNPKTVMTGSWPIVRYLYNVYSNGQNENVPEATAATLNYVSEVGFICKTQTVTGGAGNKPTTATLGTYGTITTTTTTKDIVDPGTGLWYHDEIFNTILENGFIPLGATVSGATYGTIKDGPPTLENTGSVVSAYSLLDATTGSTKYGATYLMTGANTSIASSSDPTGYCLVHSTTSTSTADT